METKPSNSPAPDVATDAARDDIHTISFQGTHHASAPEITMSKNYKLGSHASVLCCFFLLYAAHYPVLRSLIFEAGVGYYKDNWFWLTLQTALGFISLLCFVVCFGVWFGVKSSLDSSIQGQVFCAVFSEFLKKRLLYCFAFCFFWISTVNFLAYFVFELATSLPVAR